MLLNTFSQNKITYLAYNEFRKNIFSELAPRDSEGILYLLPWMLSVNEPAVPGYIPDLKRPIAVFGAATDRAIITREPTFRKRFEIKKHGPILKPSARASLIQGIYTIGSVGTISQTSASDCDIWICVDEDQFDGGAREHLSQKVNLIKDWMDSHLKMPVYFFICDVEDIRQGNFGSIDRESSGSAQRNVLKEEFYRTSILISGKILLWWVCFDPDSETDYEAFAAQYAKDTFGDYNFIDLGPLPSIDSDEYFGAALWQFNKALTHPLKSVIKMLLLEMLLSAPREELLCHRFRNLILNQKRDFAFCDPNAFTWGAVLEHNKDRAPDTFAFIQKCYYLRHDLKFHTKMQGIREKLAREIFTNYPLKRDEIYRLNDFATWPMIEQLEFGEKMLGLLTTIYRDISANQGQTASTLTHRDMTIIGRKLAVCLEKKEDKVSLIHKPTANLNLPNLTFSFKKDEWQVLTTGKTSKPLITCTDITSCIAYLVWNDLYEAMDVRMAPNATPVTLQEIHNLARRIRKIFGTFDITGVNFENFLEPEKAARMLVIVSFEGLNNLKDFNDFGVLYDNHWGELFFRRFDSPRKFKAFIENGKRKFSAMEIHYYVRRNSLYFEKTIERTKMLITHILHDVTRP